MTEGACGESERVLLAPATLGSLLAASPSARMLLFEDPQTRRLTVFDVASQRATESSGHLVAFSTDERRVVLWDRASGDAGELLEVDAGTGRSRRPVDVSVKEPFYGDGAWRWVVLAGVDGRIVAYDRRDGAVLVLAHPEPGQLPARTPPGAPERVLVRDANGFVLWDLERRETKAFPDAQSAELLADGSGVTYVGADGRRRGWSALGGEVVLGTPWAGEGALNARRPGLRPVSARGQVFHRGADDAVLWSTAEGRVEPLGPNVYYGTFDPAGSRLALSRREPEGDATLRIRDLATGAEEVLAHAPNPWGVQWTADGARLIAFANWLDLQTYDVHYMLRLFGAGGAETPLVPAEQGSRPDMPLEIGLSPDGRTLVVEEQAEEVRLYDLVTGERRYTTSRACVGAEGCWFSWGPDGLFYGRSGAYGGPPDGGLFAWNPRDGTETTLGRATDPVCFAGGYQVFRHDLAYDEPGPGPLSAWSSATGTRVQLSTSALLPRCVPGTAAVVFLEGGELVHADAARGCRQVLASGVDAGAFLPRDADVLVRTADGVWRVGYPR